VVDDGGGGEGQSGHLCIWARQVCLLVWVGFCIAFRTLTCFVTRIHIWFESCCKITIC
jgi:hypothetical protein